MKIINNDREMTTFSINDEEIPEAFKELANINSNLHEALIQSNNDINLDFSVEVNETSEIYYNSHTGYDIHTQNTDNESADNLGAKTNTANLENLTKIYHDTNHNQNLIVMAKNKLYELWDKFTNPF